MVGKISRVFINEILLRTNIVNLIHQKVKLKRHGKNFYACCPFHHEKHPSFTVNEEKQFFYCFSCRIHGNAIDFLMYYNKFSFIESIDELAQMHNLTITNNNFYNKNNLKLIYEKQKILTLMNELTIFYQNALNHTLSLSTKIAKKYLKNRGLNQKILQYFSVGFAPEEENNIIKKFNSFKKTQPLLNKIGMINTNYTGKLCNKFQKRIMFPIKNYKGQVIAFGGRTINSTKLPKYINSPESNIFYKRKQLYGLYEAKTSNKNIIIPKILIVEGYMDVISLTQFGINYAVASLGTATTNEQIKKIYKITNKIICCYDGDKAGHKAAWRTLQTVIPYLTDNRQINFMFLPKGEDPDTMIRKIGKQGFTKLIENSEPLSKFLFNKLLNQIDLSIPEGRAKFSAIALPIINKIPGETLRICLRQKLGQKIGILDEIHLEKFITKKIIKNYNCTQKKIKNRTLQILIILLINNPNFAYLVPTTTVLKKINLLEITLFIDIIQLCKNQPQVTSTQLLNYYQNNKMYQKIKQSITWNYKTTKNMTKNIFIDALSKLYNDILKQIQEKLIAKDRIQKITIEEKKELWIINQTLKKTK